VNRLILVTVAVIVAAVAPALACLLTASIPLILIVGVVAAVLRVIWFYTRG
jgi:hypothetical protein